MRPRGCRFSACSFYSIGQSVPALLTATILCVATAQAVAAESTDEIISSAKQLLAVGQGQRALALLNEAIEKQPANLRLLSARASISETLGQYQSAVADCSQILNASNTPLAPKAAADLYERRGCLHFFLAQIDESIADFDKEIEIEPARRPGHWKRGIDYYYAQRWQEGCDQFAAYQSVDSNDVENATWWFLCKARSAGVQSARRGMLKIGKDQRVPMTEIYQLFLEQATPDEVLKAARGGQPSAEELKSRLFYAHLYLGLWHEIMERPAQSLAEIRQAVEEFDIGGYMWQVARVHVALRSPKSGAVPK